MTTNEEDSRVSSLCFVLFHCLFFSVLYFFLVFNVLKTTALYWCNLFIGQIGLKMPLFQLDDHILSTWYMVTEFHFQWYVHTLYIANSRVIYLLDNAIYSILTKIFVYSDCRLTNGILLFENVLPCLRNGGVIRRSQNSD